MIEVNNLTRRPLNKLQLIKLAKLVLTRENKKKQDISIALVSPKAIKTLNRKYRQVNKPTDVLSFNYEGGGEIVICPKEAGKKAKDLQRVLIHGLLHILGYEHEKGKKKAKLMEEKEDFYLNKVVYG